MCADNTDASYALGTLSKVERHDGHSGTRNCASGPPSLLNFTMSFLYVDPASLAKQFSVDLPSPTMTPGSIHQTNNRATAYPNGEHYVANWPYYASFQGEVELRTKHSDCVLTVCSDPVSAVVRTTIEQPHGVGREFG